MAPTGRCGSSTSPTWGEDALLVHDPHRMDSGLAFSLARLAEDPTGPTPIGIFRDIQRHVYGRAGVVSDEPPTEDELGELLLSGEIWTVG